MRWAQIRKLDISNGEKVGISIFIQGCHFHCANCFNLETWDFNGGKEWTEETKKTFFKLIDRTYIKRISILGGEPLAEENLDDVLDLVTEINKQYNNIQNQDADTVYNHTILNKNTNKTRLSIPQKTIWLYTGYEWEHIFNQRWHYHPRTQEKLSIGRWKRQQIVSQCDVLIDGQFIDSQKNLSLKWRGSSNQRVISVQESLEQDKIILY